MARSFYPLTVENRVEDVANVEVRHEASGLTYTVVAEEDGLYQEEFILAPDGRKTHRLRRRMDYVIGSGHVARTYLTESNGRLYELPLTWYTEKQQWDFSPGYATKNGRFDRLMPDRCMACHNSYPGRLPFVEGKYTAVPEGIGCERCHGPGTLHVAERLADPKPAGDVDDTIVNPRHLSFERRLDVCNQCHLQTTVSVLREGRTIFGFQPSEALSNHLALFVAHDETGAEDDVAVVSHAERMRLSACFRATRTAERPLECLTCHNPHEGFREQGPRYFNDTCTRCHNAEALASQMAQPEVRQQHAATANCIRCHMPKVEASDAPHATFTDHWIRVVGGEPAASVPDRPRAVMEPYFERDAGNREGQRYLGMALIVHGRQQNSPRLMATGAATLEAGLGADTTHGEAYFLLGVAYQQLGALDRAIPALERAVRADPRVPQRLSALAQAYEDDARDPRVVERLYRQALGIQPALADVRVRYGHFLQAQGRVEEAVAAYEAALAEQPWFDAAALALGTALVARHQEALAEEAFRKALHLNPANTEVFRTMLLFETTGRAGEERITAVRAVTPLPDSLPADGPAVDEIGLVPDATVDSVATGGVLLRFTNLPSRATVQIHTDQGTLLRALERRGTDAALRWDLRTEAGRIVPSGTYLIHVRAQDGTGRTLGTRVLRRVLIRQHTR